MKFIGAHIFDYDATFRGDVTIEGNLAISNSVSQNISFGDSDSLYFGNSNDIEIVHVNDQSFIINNTGDLIFDQRTDDRDIIFKCDDGSGGTTTYITLDGSHTRTNVHKNLRFDDNIGAVFGSGAALKLHSDGSNGLIDNFQGNLIIRQQVDDADIAFQSDDGSGSVTSYITLDGSQGLTIANKVIRFVDGVSAAFGTDGDGAISHSGSRMDIINTLGNLNIKNFADDSDISFQCDDGTGGTTEYFRLDGGDADGTLVYTKWADNSIVTLGASKDLRIFHNGTNSIIQNHTGNLSIRNSADDSDIIFDCDDGSGGLTAYLTLDGSTTHSYFSAGNVGIGTSSPNRQLQVKRTTGTASIAITSSNTGLAQLELGGTSDNDIAGVTYNGATSTLSLKTNNTGQLHVTNAGRVGVGTSSPNAALDIQGSAADLRLTSTGQNRTALANTSTGFEISQTGNKAIYFLTNGTEKARISGGGTLGIATTSPDSNYKLDVNGKAQVRSVLELDDVLTLNAISTPADPGTNQSSIYMDSADGAIRVKINVGGTTVTRTLATFE